MGKPFKQELSLINETFKWANSVEIDDLAEMVTASIDAPLITVGSGGSLSACHFVNNLHQSKGKLAKAMTPLELFNANTVINQSSLMFLSASGKNTDILTAFEIAIREEPRLLTGLTFRPNSALKLLSEKKGAGKIFEYLNPAGKDGFLATNSLIGFFAIMNRAYGNTNGDSLLISASFLADLDSFIRKINGNYTFQVLYSGYGLPVAVDLESKFAEAALGDILYSDYRNFGHGRHHWLDKRGNNTCIVALITPDNETLAEKTLALLPKTVPILRISSSAEGHFASMDLLAKSFHLVSELGYSQNIDPGKPGVPDYGRKLYHLRYTSTLKKATIDPDIKVAIQRKIGARSFETLTPQELDSWISAYKGFKQRIQTKQFGCIIFDYDGTLCAGHERFIGVSSEMANLLNELLANGILVGIATGRGKSIREDLQKVIKREYQKNLCIGYHNGAEIGTLDDDSIPPLVQETHQLLLEIRQLLFENFGVEGDTKGKQLTLKFDDKLHGVKDTVVEFILSKGFPNIVCVQSSHSIDLIVKPDVSKLNVVDHCSKILKQMRTEHLDVLCLGDKGRFPGNDYELLSHSYSLSVDETSSDKSSCWNFSPPGLRQINATLYYLNRIKIHNNFFKISL